MHPDVLVYDESFVIWHTREVEARTVSKRHLLLAREVEEARTLACEEGGHRRRELCLPAREVPEDVGTVTILLSYHHTDYFSLQRNHACFLHHFSLSLRIAPSMHS